MRFVHVGKINVSLWGRRVGSLVAAPQRDVYAFRFEREFISSGIEISPLMMPLRREPYVFPDLPHSAYSGWVFRKDAGTLWNVVLIPASFRRSI